MGALIKKYIPNASILIYFSSDKENRFGADMMKTCLLLKKSKELGLQVVGVYLPIAAEEEEEEKEEMEEEKEKDQEDEEMEKEDEEKEKSDPAPILDIKALFEA